MDGSTCTLETEENTQDGKGLLFEVQHTTTNCYHTSKSDSALCIRSHDLTEMHLFTLFVASCCRYLKMSEQVIV